MPGDDLAGDIAEEPMLARRSVLLRRRAIATDRIDETPVWNGCISEALCVDETLGLPGDALVEIGLNEMIEMAEWQNPFAATFRAPVRRRQAPPRVRMSTALTPKRSRAAERVGTGGRPAAAQLDYG